MEQHTIKTFDKQKHPHRRYNPLLNEWVLVSPHRANRPWQGQMEDEPTHTLAAYDPACYLCPGNERSNGLVNPAYSETFIFNNDFPALLTEDVFQAAEPPSLFRSEPERGINKVVCFSPKHNLTMAELTTEEIESIIYAWKQEYITLGKEDFINYVQIFENKGSVMGCSNPHPHGQIWAQTSLPTQIERTQKNLTDYYQKEHRSLLADYVLKELETRERTVFENEYFVVLVPFWAVWPFETMIISKRHFHSIADMTQQETAGFADILKRLTIRYDNLFNTSFPYSSGMHQSPTDGQEHPEWHFHMHFYPPLLRSASVKKFMVGYELLAESQRDITPEKSAELLKNLPEIHYKEVIKQ